ncbi:MAG UNVERIFIED_CONTAM: hypothetical protein LVR18_10495 [Planctomycetaceae bacterium]|jgi:excinuclease ABC subunit A
MPKPRVESIQGLSPAIAIEQKTVGATPRSTVGTVTEIYDYLRVLYAAAGQPYCPHCQIPAVKQTTDQIVESILQLPAGTRLLLTAPLQIDRTVPFTKVRDRLREDGFARVRIDGTTYDLEQFPDIDHRRQHDLAIVVDRIAVDIKQRSRIADSVEASLDPGKGVMLAVIADSSRPEHQVEITSLQPASVLQPVSAFLRTADTTEVLLQQPARMVPKLRRSSGRNSVPTVHRLDHRP